MLYSETIAASGLQHDSRTKKKPKSGPQHAPTPTVNAKSAKGKAREDTTVAPIQLEKGDWLGLIDRILQVLKKRFLPYEKASYRDEVLPSHTQTFLCEVLSAILLRLYRAYSLEKLFGRGNFWSKDALKDAIEQDNLEMSFQALTRFADRHGYRHIETVRGNRATSTQSGSQFFDWIWGSRPHEMSRKRWDTAPFRQQYYRIRDELERPEPARFMRAELEDTLRYRFLQSQTVFSYPDGNGTFGSTIKLARGEIAQRVWYHQTPLQDDPPVLLEGEWGVKDVVRCNINPNKVGEYEKPRRLPEYAQSWEQVISQCRKQRLDITSQQ